MPDGPVLGMGIGQFDAAPTAYVELPDTYGMWDGERTHLAHGEVLPPADESHAIVVRTRIADDTLCGRPTAGMVLPTHLNGYGGQPIGAPWCLRCSEAAFGPGFIALHGRDAPDG